MQARCTRCPSSRPTRPTAAACGGQSRAARIGAQRRQHLGRPVGAADAAAFGRHQVQRAGRHTLLPAAACNHCCSASASVGAAWVRSPRPERRPVPGTGSAAGFTVEVPQAGQRQHDTGRHHRPAALQARARPVSGVGHRRPPAQQAKATSSSVTDAPGARSASSSMAPAARTRAWLSFSPSADRPTSATGSRPRAATASAPTATAAPARPATRSAPASAAPAWAATGHGIGQSAISTRSASHAQQRQQRQQPRPRDRPPAGAAAAPASVHRGRAAPGRGTTAAPTRRVHG
jgi:hypothetical protein